MIRTIVSISESSKKWLDRYSRHKGQSVAETIRIAIQEFRVVEGGDSKHLLDKTAGVLKDNSDSVKFVRKIRGEWDS